VAVDASAEQVAGRGPADSTHAWPGEALPFAGEFDAVFSNAALHWMRDAAAVLGSVHRALRPGGRFVAEMGGAGNVAAIRSALVAALDRRGLDGAGLDLLFLPTAERVSRPAGGAWFPSGRSRSSRGRRRCRASCRPGWRRSRSRSCARCRMPIGRA
jgi:SAM-dependent methyltransferase